MVKADVNVRIDSLLDLQVLLNQWFATAVIKRFDVLRGGYSGTNYKIYCDDGWLGNEVTFAILQSQLARRSY